MSNSFIVNRAKVGVVLENDTANHVGTNTTGVGSLYDAGSATYGVVTFNTDVTIDTAEYEQESFQVVDDHMDHYINLRYNGSGSCTAKAIDDTTAGTLDAYNVFYASLHLPNGSDTAAGATDLTWSGTLDTNGGVIASDIRGYGVIVEQMVGTGIYYQWVFHNCRIKATPGRSPKQAMTINLRWDDARIVQFINSATTFVDHTD